MRELSHLFENNRVWAADMTSHDPQFFERLSRQQSPQFLWIGCADSRVPANVIVGLAPGELFVHRNISNLVVHTDLNCLSVLQYAVDVLRVRHVIVCGHYGCGGVEAAFSKRRVGLSDNWLRHIQDVLQKNKAEIEALPESKAQLDRLCELNVIEQVRHTAQTSIVQDAWTRGQDVSIHGWIYGINDGLIRDLGVLLTRSEEARPKS